MPIYCLFSVENNYDQPLNNLVSAWLEKPTIEDFASSFLPENVAGLNVFVAVQKYGAMLSAITEIYQGREATIGGVEYRLEAIEPGKRLKQN